MDSWWYNINFTNGHGKLKPVIKKAMVELEGAPFKKFTPTRDEWAVKNPYVSPVQVVFS